MAAALFAELIRRILKAANKTMETTKFVVRVNRGGILNPEYVQRIDPNPHPGDLQP